MNIETRPPAETACEINNRLKELPMAVYLAIFKAMTINIYRYHPAEWRSLRKWFDEGSAKK